MEISIRFNDENKTLSHFYNEVWVVCPACKKRATATVDFETKIARLSCLNCGHNKEMTTQVTADASVQMPAHQFFKTNLWLQAPFKNDLFFAYNLQHLLYLERYITARLREHKDRTHFTLLEKLPKFYHEAKNRQALLKIIDKLKKENE